MYSKTTDPTSRSVKINNLSPNTRYQICVLALGNWPSRKKEKALESRLSMKSKILTGRQELEKLKQSAISLLVDTPTSKCEEITTLSISDVLHIGSVSDHSYGMQSILTRRLGLIVGCCMGFVVFIVLVSVLGYLKVKKQRAAAKREVPLPPEYISYRHFSIQSGETGAHGHHPQFITNMNTTVLNQ